MSFRHILSSAQAAVAHLVGASAALVACASHTVRAIYFMYTPHIMVLAHSGGASERYRLIDDVTMSPTASGIPGGAFVQEIINWLGQYGLWAALGAMIIGGAIYGFSTLGGNGYQGSRGRTIALAGLAGAAVIGLAPTVINLVFHAASA